MRKGLLILLTVSMLAVLSACGSSNEGTESAETSPAPETSDVEDAEDVVEETKAIDFDAIINAPSKDGAFAGFTFKYPETWGIRVSDDEKYLYIYPTENASDGYVMLYYSTMNEGDAETNIATMADSVLSSDYVVESVSNTEITINDWTGREIVYYQLINDMRYYVDACFIPHEDEGVLSVALTFPEESENDFSKEFLQILLTIEYKGEDVGEETETSELDAIINAPSKDGAFAGFTFKYPETWEVSVDDDGNTLYIYSTENTSDEVIMLMYDPIYEGDFETYMASETDEILANDDKYELISNEEITINDWTGREIVYYQLINDMRYYVDACYIPHEDEGVLCAGLVFLEDSESDLSEGFLQIILTIEYNGGVKSNN